jgi:dynein heavy chain
LEDIGYLQKYAEDAFGGDVFEKSVVDSMMVEPLIYQPFIHEKETGDFAYMPTKSWDQLKDVLEEKLEEYNETNIVMNLVLFKDAMSHVCRIVRMLFQPGGNALLVGVGGSGKQSLAKLATFILGYETQ